MLIIEREIENCPSRRNCCLVNIFFPGKVGVCYISCCHAFAPQGDLLLTTGRSQQNNLLILFFFSSQFLSGLFANSKKKENRVEGESFITASFSAKYIYLHCVVGRVCVFFFATHTFYVKGTNSREYIHTGCQSEPRTIVKMMEIISVLCCRSCVSHKHWLIVVNVLFIVRSRCFCLYSLQVMKRL